MQRLIGTLRPIRHLRHAARRLMRRVDSHHPIFVCLLLASPGVFMAGCTHDESAFYCGLRGGETLTSCTGAEQVCICATNKCAEPDRRSDPENRCASGLRYLHEPFGPADLPAGRCVPAVDAVNTVRGEDVCGVDDDEDASTDSTGDTAGDASESDAGSDAAPG